MTCADIFVFASLNHQEENYKTNKKKVFPGKELTYLLTLPGNKAVMCNCSATTSPSTRSWLFQSLCSISLLVLQLAVDVCCRLAGNRYDCNLQNLNSCQFKQQGKWFFFLIKLILVLASTNVCIVILHEPQDLTDVATNLCCAFFGMLFD